MRQPGFLFIASLVLAFTGTASAQDEGPTTIVHAGTLLATPGEAPTSNQSVLIRDGRILEIRDGFVEAEDDATTIVDLSDKFVLPGLMDMHVHLTGGRPRPEYARTSASDSAIRGVANAKKTLLAGFTTVRDAGCNVLGVAKVVNEGGIPGPRLFPSGGFLSQTGGHADTGFFNDRIGDQDDLERHAVGYIVDGVTEARRAARMNLRAGATQIKIMAGGGVASQFDPIHMT